METVNKGAIATVTQAPRATKAKKKHSEATHPRVKQGPSASKRARLAPYPQSMSSTQLANSVMKFRLGGSISDPLNLEGSDEKQPDGECSTCAPSPALPSGQPSPLPQYLQRDPLNLEGKVKKFPLHKQSSGGAGASHIISNKPNYKKRARYKRRTTSKSEDQECNEETDKKAEEKKAHKSLSTRDSVFRYGNYDRYYGYRNCGVNIDDPRLSMLRKEWFEGKDCLDIGSNTGQVTIRIACDFKPRKILGIDIDSRLVRMAQKNLHREHVSAVAPDGRLFPQSLLISRGPPVLPSLVSSTTGVISQAGRNKLDISDSDVKGEDIGKYPFNVEFRQCNYVPMEDILADTQTSEYDTILALSVTKWVHLNWGDAGIRRFFKRISNHLRPGGVLILEPQPFGSYSKKKKLTPDIFKNYQSISFFPRDFHSYLMSSDVGFTKHELLGVPDNQSKGFRRPLHVYIKANPPSISSSQVNILPASSSTSSTRLKSVVGDVSKKFTLATTPVDWTGDRKFTKKHAESCSPDDESMQTLVFDSEHRLDHEDVLAENVSK